MRRTAFVVSISSLLLPTVRARPASRKFHPPPHLDEVLAEQLPPGKDYWNFHFNNYAIDIVDI